ncbi:MAG: hypothetical protein R3C14_53705 [Caldilineaceae bacterium]
MMKQRKSLLAVVVVVLIVALAGCMASTVQVPGRPITISNADALAAQNAGLAALATGKVEWTENQFSSLMTDLLKNNTGSNMPVDAIHAWFEPNNEIYLRVLLKPDVLKTGDTLDLKGSVEVVNHHVVVNLQEAGAGAMSVSAPIMTMLNSQIDKALASANLGVAASVTTETGKLMIRIGG